MKKRRPNKEADQDKKRQRIALFGSLIMVGILLFSTFAYYMTQNGASSTANQMTYGAYTFSLKSSGNGNGVLVTDIQGQEVEFQALPAQVAYLNVDPLAIRLLQAAPQVVLTVDTNLTKQDASTVDYDRLMLNLAIPKMINAIKVPDPRYKMPVLNCSNATVNMPVVQFIQSNDTKVTTEGYCITIQGEQRELLLIKDRIIYEYYGILVDGQVANP